MLQGVICWETCCARNKEHFDDKPMVKDSIILRIVGTISNIYQAKFPNFESLMELHDMLPHGYNTKKKRVGFISIIWIPLLAFRLILIVMEHHAEILDLGVVV